MMKRVVTAGLVFFWMLYVDIVVAGLVISAPKKEATRSNTNQTVTTVNLGHITLDAAEIAKHKSTDSCWMIINEKAYDITNFFGSHPGGNPFLAFYCGKDASVAFDFSPHSHSDYAKSLLVKYLLGNVGQVLN